MRKLLFLLISGLLVLTGCNTYKTEEECLLKEIQKCADVEGSLCQRAAKDFCRSEFKEPPKPKPEPKKKTEAEIQLEIIQEQNKAKDLAIELKKQEEAASIAKKKEIDALDKKKKKEKLNLWKSVECKVTQNIGAYKDKMEYYPRSTPSFVGHKFFFIMYKDSYEKNIKIYYTDTLGKGVKELRELTYSHPSLKENRLKASVPFKGQEKELRGNRKPLNPDWGTYPGQYVHRILWNFDQSTMTVTDGVFAKCKHASPSSIRKLAQ